MLIQLWFGRDLIWQFTFKATAVSHHIIHTNMVALWKNQRMYTRYFLACVIFINSNRKHHIFCVRPCWKRDAELSLWQIKLEVIAVTVLEDITVLCRVAWLLRNTYPSTPPNIQIVEKSYVNSDVSVFTQVVWKLVLYTWSWTTDRSVKILKTGILCSFNRKKIWVTPRKTKQKRTATEKKQICFIQAVWIQF